MSIRPIKLFYLRKTMKVVVQTLLENIVLILALLDS